MWQADKACYEIDLWRNHYNHERLHKIICASGVREAGELT